MGKCVELLSTEWVLREWVCPFFQTSGLIWPRACWLRQAPSRWDRGRWCP